MLLPPILQQLDLLNRSSPDFHDQLSNVLYGEEYQQCMPNLQGEDLVWLVDYLDMVRCHIALPRLRLSQPRLLMASILPVPLFGNVYASSEAYVALGGYSQRRTHFRLTSSTLITIHLLPEVMAMCTMGPSMVQGFASSVCGFILEMIRKGRPKCVVDAVVSASPSIIGFVDLLPRGCDMETFDAPKHITLAGCHH